MLKSLKKTLLLFTGVLFIAVGMTGYFMFDEVTDFFALKTKKVEETTSNFITLEPQDEYVLTSIISTESFSKMEFKEFAGWPIGDSSATISVRAHFKYFIRLSELQYHYNVESHSVLLRIPRFYLASPVAFDSTTLRTSGQKKLLGSNPQTLENELMLALSENLYLKGLQSRKTAMIPAARALADNLFQYYQANDIAGDIKEVVVEFAGQDRDSTQVFRY